MSSLLRSSDNTTKRVQRIYRRIQDEMLITKDFWTDGFTLFTDPTVAEEPLVVRQAMAFALILREVPVRIFKDELIVGHAPPNVAGKRRTFPVDYATQAEKDTAAAKRLAAGTFWGHFVLDYGKVISRGFRAVREEAVERLASVTPREDPDGRKRSFLRAVAICYDGAMDLVRRYQVKALEMAAIEPDSLRRSELEEIAAILVRVPEYPANSFREALQSFWLVYCILHCTANNHPVGRFDQYIYPYLRAELDIGHIDLDKAAELVQLLWLKFNERSLMLPLIDPDKYVGCSTSQAFMHWGEIPVEGDYGNPAMYNNFMQNVILGGQTYAGEDASNELTLLCLDASLQFSLTQPIVSLRVWRETPSVVLEKAAELIRSGSGMPPIFNDEVFVPAFTALGLPVEVARDYSNDGCWETLIPGKTEYRYSPIHALDSLELAMNRGVNLLDGLTRGIDTGDPLTFETFDQLYAAFREQLRFQVHRTVKGVVDSYGDLYSIAPTPFVSSLLDGCLETARDVTEGGARYVFHSPILTGIPNTADSLAAIKKLVFQDRTVTLAELVVALRAGFQGYEELRLLLLHRGPKYGNDDDHADDLANMVLEDFAELVDKEMKEHSSISCRQIQFPPASGTFEMYRIIGKRLGASADGRGSGDPLATNLSPVPGMDRMGPLASLRSYTKLNLQRLPCGTEVDLSLQHDAVVGPDGLARLVGLIRSFVVLGGEIMTVSVNSVEQLRAAQREPHKWGHLRVRMGGWSAYFVCLDREHQEHHIARYERMGGF